MSKKNAGADDDLDITSQRTMQTSKTKSSLKRQSQRRKRAPVDPKELDQLDFLN